MKAILVVPAKASEAGVPLLDDFAGYHLYAARGVLTARELREFYGYWSCRMLPRRQADGPLLGPTFEGLHGPARTYDVRRPKLY